MIRFLDEILQSAISMIGSISRKPMMYVGIIICKTSAFRRIFFFSIWLKAKNNAETSVMIIQFIEFFPMESHVHFNGDFAATANKCAINKTVKSDCLQAAAPHLEDFERFELNGIYY
jgi:hypothetical protein